MTHHAYSFEKTDFLNDPKNLISRDFKIDKDFRDQVTFWFKIYTQFTSTQYILHDKSSPKLILKVVNQSDHPKRSAELVQKSYLNEYLEAFDHLSKDSPLCDLCTELKLLYREELAASKLTPQYFYKFKKNQLRFQTGQKDFIEKGLHFYKSFEVKMQELLKAFDLPAELIALSFLESSFNPEAKSKLNAAGIWQFMKSTGQDYLLIDSKQDQRLNPLISTLGAFRYLKQLRKYLSRWDLAIWSYNSGASHVQKAQATFERPLMTLADFFKLYEHSSIGFASKNFYPSFLALVHALAYKADLYNLPKGNYLSLKPSKLHFYISLCSIKPRWFFDNLKNFPATKKLNMHLKDRYHDTKFPRGTILISEAVLTPKRYYEVPTSFYTQRYPKNWIYLIKGLKCQL